MRNDKDNLIVNFSVEFALAVIEYCEMLEANRKFVIANQLLKSGTSIEEVSKLFSKDNQAVLVDLGNGKHHIITKYDIIGSIK